MVYLSTDKQKDAQDRENRRKALGVHEDPERVR